MGWFDKLFGGSDKQQDDEFHGPDLPRRQTDRYGQPGTWRHNRGSDVTERDEQGRFRKKD